MIDNYDSFTFNIVRYLWELGADVEVVKSDQISLDQIVAKQPSGVVISPGPCGPSEAGVSLQAIAFLAGKLPLLGVCLGHQCIAQAFGGRIVPASKVMHGKTSLVYHESLGVFDGVPSPFKAARYHSLVVEERTLPDCLEITARADNNEGGEIMGIRHKTLQIEGVQFHPEAIMSENGHKVLNNFLHSVGG